MAVQVSKTRPLPQLPLHRKEEVDATWYEHQERMRPSYITQPHHQYQQPAISTSFGAETSPDKKLGGRWSLPAPSARELYSTRQELDYQQQQLQQYYSRMIGDQTRKDAMQKEQKSVKTQRPRIQHLNSAPSRFRSQKVNSFRPFALDGSDEERRGGMAQGSAFVHKGFFDIMSLVNNQGLSLPMDCHQEVGGLRATFSKATGRFRRLSTPVKQNLENPFLCSPAPTVVKASSPLANISLTKSNSANDVPRIASLGGPRAQKKRISVDMVGAPKIGTFVHAAHASDAEQAEEILRRWSRDGIGKVADPIWIDRCKEAMKLQYQRNQAEAIAQVQAAFHQDSLISINPRALQIMNGAPSPSLASSNFTVATSTSSTANRATIGHGAIKEAMDFHDIIEEDGLNYDRPSTPKRAIPPAGPRPNMKLQTNMQGTVLIVPSPEPVIQAQQRFPDYLHYQPLDHATPPPLVEFDSPSIRKEKEIDGLPGMRGGVGAMFDRPTSIVILDQVAADPKIENLSGDRLALPVALEAGAALQPSLTTVEKSVAAKIFFENLYYGILKKPRDRDTRKEGLEKELAGLRISEVAKDAIRAKWAANESEYLRDIRSKVNVNSFTRLKTIGHGAFGVVALVREQKSGQLYAMKQLRKADMLRKGQEGHVRAERDLMTSASASTNAKCIVKLVYSFQDVDHLYLIMEFMGGGDLLNLLIEKDIFAEDFARFYVAEMILAIHEAHQLGYIHRDIKPDNFLFTSQGHIKLADFGLCQSFHWAHDGAYYDQQRKNLLKKHGIDLEDSEAGRIKKRSANFHGQGQAQQQLKDGNLTDEELGVIMSDRNKDGTPLTHVLTWREKNKRKIAYSVVGTNNYMAPEVLRGLGYDQSCDWWSLGVIVFEMIYGYPPFVSKSRHLTRQKILNWKQTLRFPPKPRVSREVQDFISKLICEKDDRLGSMNNASVSRPNSLLQGNRQPSGFAVTDGKPKGTRGGLLDGVEDLMAHPWFKSIDWNRIYISKAPFKPALSHAADTKHFEDDIEDEPLPAPGAAEAIKEGRAIPIEQPRDPMLRDKNHGKHLLEMRKQLAFVGYTFKSPKDFDAKAQLTESKFIKTEDSQQQQPDSHLCTPTEGGSRLRSMSM